jgi:hypothetical protein
MSIKEVYETTKKEGCYDINEILKTAYIQSTPLVTAFVSNQIQFFFGNIKDTLN